MIKHVEIENQKGMILRGYLHLPENAKKVVVFFHGFTGNKTEHNAHFRNIARMLEKENVASLRMDYHGNGESDGEFTDFNFDVLLDDAQRMINYAKNIPGIEHVAIFGFSLGGAVASLSANDDNCEQLVLISPAGCMPITGKKAFDNARKLDNGNAYFSGFEMSEEFVKSIEAKDMYANCDKFNKNVLVIHGTKDLSVSYLYGVRYSVAYSNSRLVLIEGSGHGYDTYEQKNELYKHVIDFLK